MRTKTSTHVIYKLVDFGFAIDLDNWDGMEPRREGTPRYECPESKWPELFPNNETIDLYSRDIWSAGVTIKELLDGTCPFGTLDIYGQYYQDYEKFQSSLKELDKPLRDVLSSMMKQNFQHRVSSCDLGDLYSSLQAQYPALSRKNDSGYNSLLCIASMPSLICRSQISIKSKFGQYILTVVQTVRELQV